MIDLSSDRRSVERQIQGFIRKDQVVPFRVLQHYAHILTVDGTLTPSGSSGGSTGGGNTGSSGGGTSAATIGSGIDTSNDIDTIVTEIQKLVTSANAASIRAQVEAALSDSEDHLNNIETAIGDQGDTATTAATSSGSLIAIVKGLWTSLTSSFESLESAFSGTDASTVNTKSVTVPNNTSTNVVAANTNRTELTIQNKNEDNVVFITKGTTASTTNSLTLPPYGIVSYQGIKAQQEYVSFNNSGAPGLIYVEEAIISSNTDSGGLPTAGGGPQQNQ